MFQISSIFRRKRITTEKIPQLHPCPCTARISLLFFSGHALFSAGRKIFLRHFPAVRICEDCPWKSSILENTIIYHTERFQKRSESFLGEIPKKPAPKKQCPRDLSAYLPVGSDRSTPFSCHRRTGSCYSYVSLPSPCGSTMLGSGRHTTPGRTLHSLALRYGRKSYHDVEARQTPRHGRA